jgi:hypothetical protein
MFFVNLFLFCNWSYLDIQQTVQDKFVSEMNFMITFFIVISLIRRTHFLVLKILYTFATKLFTMMVIIFLSYKEMMLLFTMKTICAYRRFITHFLLFNSTT